jgi:hypothetical protein
MIILAIKCLGCNDIIYSRARHDFHYCSCGKTFVDGGFDYLRAGFDEKVGYATVNVEVEGVTKESLYEDWNKGLDKYGVIKGEKND